MLRLLQLYEYLMKVCTNSTVLIMFAYNVQRVVALYAVHVSAPCLSLLIHSNSEFVHGSYARTL
jgi:hypothetical protein